MGRTLLEAEFSMKAVPKAAQVSVCQQSAAIGSIEMKKSRVAAC